MIVCVCRKVSEREIRLAVRGGTTALDELGFELGVATQCGRCGDCAHRIVRDELGRCRGGAGSHADALAHCASATA